ncbi:MAG: hypothetical protein AAF563_06915 [Pseudomonadota bacterium]
MLDHPAIDIALATILFYIVLSLVASSVQEWIASMLGLRSKNLNAGIKRLIGDQYTQRVYRHPLIANLAKAGKLPSYIDPKTLSTVLLELIARDNASKSYVTCTADDVRGIVGKISDDHPLKEILDTWLTEGEDAANTLKDRLASWFDEGMSRMSGWYARRVKVIIFVIAAAVTIATNASSIHFVEELWRNDILRSQLAAQAVTLTEAAASTDEMPNVSQDLNDFPIGWYGLPEDWVAWLKTVLGWAITIAAISLGAPFWFDLLSKVARLRGTGARAGSNNRDPSSTS